MAEAYAIELRERVIEAYQAGEGSAATIAARFKVGEATVKRWLWRQRDHGHVRPTKKAGGTASEIERAEIDAIVARLVDANAVEIAAAYNRGRRGSGRVHVSTIKRALHRFGYVVKKNADGRSRFCARTSSKNAARS
jgi:transposase